jgi:salicylate hydroxylase
MPLILFFHVSHNCNISVDDDNHLLSVFSYTDTGQGGAQAFEDAAALGTLFPENTTPEQVRCRLELYNEVRYKRAVTIMFNSKVPDNRRHEQLDDLRNYVPDAEMPTDIFKYVWSWDVVEAATQALARSAKEKTPKR